MTQQPIAPHPGSRIVKSALWHGQLLLAFVAGVVLLGGYSFADAAVRRYGPMVLAWWGQP